MSEHHEYELFHRHRMNPILTAADWPYPIPVSYTHLTLPTSDLV